MLYARIDVFTLSSFLRWWPILNLSLFFAVPTVGFCLADVPNLLFQRFGNVLVPQANPVPNSIGARDKKKDGGDMESC